MKELVTDILINAPPSAVWKVLTDLPAYPEWNPFIRSISGDLKPGGRLTVVIQPPDGWSMTFRPRVLAATPNTELRWLGRLLIPGLFDGEHSFHLERLDESRSTFHPARVFWWPAGSVPMGQNRSESAPRLRGDECLAQASC
jgi:hypothetical protein